MNIKKYQELRSWFKVNTKFPSTIPMANILNVGGRHLSLTLTVTYLILDCTVALCVRLE